MPLPVGLIAYNKLVDYAAQRSIYADDPTANALLVGNGSSALQTIAPGTNGQVLTSNGTVWAADDPPAATVDWASPGAIGTTAPESAIFGSDASSTNTVLYPLKVQRTSSATPANNIGVGVEFETETTTNNRLSGRIRSRFTTATDASRIADMAFDVYNVSTAVAALTLTPTRATIVNELFYTYGADHYLSSPHDLGTNTVVSEKANGNLTFTGYVLRLFGNTGVDLRAIGNNTITTRTNNVVRQTIDGSGNYIINDTGADSDFRIEGDTDANLFVLDAGLDVISIGEAGVSGAKLNVNGTLRADGLRLDLTPTMESLTPTHSITISVNGTNYKIPLQAA